MELKIIEHHLSVCKVADVSDYIPVKEANFNRALEALASKGYTVV